MKIGDEVYVHGYVDEIRKDAVIIKNEGGYFGTVADEIMPSAQPEYRLDEWCTDCKEYDTEKHCCPRFNQVIRTTLNEMKSERKKGKGKWNTYYHSDIDFSYSCNQCGYSAPYQMIGGKVFQKKWNFCSNCGAKMEENV